MESVKEFFKAHIHILIVFLSIFAAIFILNKLAGMPKNESIKEAAKDAATDVIEIELKLINGEYKVDRESNQWHLDIT